MSEPKPNSIPDATATASVGEPSTASRTDTLGVPEATPAAMPVRIGEFTLLGELGRGGMGMVFRAEDPKLKREVALKVMLPQFAANPQAKARFVREARAQAKVEHDHVAAIYRVDEHDGLPYLVMPLLKGMTLHAALRANPRPPLMEVIRMGREVAEGLAAAHESGLVHRDIKPANIWLEGKKLRVKILDFGLARIALDSETTDASEGPVTREGAVLGTPAYMSPEQGRGLPVDGRTDLWSLGVMLYQMTTGELPFRGANTLAILTSLAIDHPPPPISVNPAVPQLLSDFVMALLAKDPAYRPPTAEFVAEQLRAIEVGFVNAVRMVSLTPTQQFEFQPEGPDPFADLDATEANTVPEAESLDEPVAARATPQQTKARGGFPIWAMVGGVLLAVVAIVGIVASQMGKKPAPEVAKDDTPPVIIKPNPVKPRDNTDPVKKVVAWALKSGATVEGGVPGSFETITNPDVIPGTVQAIRFHEALSDESVLENLRSLPALHNLDLHTTPLTDAGFKNLAGMPFAKSLAGLTVGGGKLTDAALDHLTFPNLASLSLRGQFTPAGVEKIRQLEKLWSLALGGCDLTDEHLLSLKGFPLSLLYVGDNPRLTDAGLSNLGRMPQLRELVIEGTGITDDGLKGIPAAMPMLARLSLTGKSSVTGQGLQLLRKSRVRSVSLGNSDLTAGNCPPLPRCEIRTGGNLLTDAADIHWREAERLVWSANRKVTIKLADGKQVEITRASDLPDDPFTLVGVEMSGGTPEELKRLAVIPTLESFVESGGAITADSIRALLASKNSLSHFYSASPFTDAEMRVIGEFTNLKQIHAGGPKVTDAGVAHLANLKGLTSVALPGSGITGAGLKQLATLPALSSLVVFDTLLGEADVETLCKMTELRLLNIARTRITEAGVKQLQNALLRCKIDWEDPNRSVATWLLEREGYKVVIAEPGTPETQIGTVANLPKGPFQVTKIEIHVACTDADVQRFSILPGLQFLGAFASHTVTTDGLKSLLHCKDTLLQLYLANGPITDEGLKSIGQLTKLTGLSLNSTNITDAGLKHLTELKALNTLSIADTAVTDAAIETLSEMTSLKHLDLIGTRFTKAGLEKLTKALPRCQIPWNPPTRLLPCDSWVSVFPIIDPKKDHEAGVGVWVRKENGIEGSHNAPNNAVRLRLPVAVRGDFMLEVEFSRPKGETNGIYVEFPLRDNKGLGLALDHRKQAILEYYGGKPLPEPGMVRDFELGTERRRVVVKMTTSETEAFAEVKVDGNPLFLWRGKWATFGGDPIGNSIPLDLSFGPPGKLVIHGVRLRMLTGDAKLTRPDDAEKLNFGKQP